MLNQQYDLRCLKSDLAEANERKTASLHSSPTKSLNPMSPPKLPLADIDESEEDLLSGFADDDSEITHLERLVLNALTSKYLREAGYKLSAITFAEEVGSFQDLDDLISLDLHIGNRSRLVSLYRNRTQPISTQLDLETDLERNQRELKEAL